jgi:hypothetical protein
MKSADLNSTGSTKIRIKDHRPGEYGDKKGPKRNLGASFDPR